MIRVIMVGVVLVILSACSDPPPDLKSPCVGGDRSPCVRRPVNVGLEASAGWHQELEKTGTFL